MNNFKQVFYHIKGVTDSTHILRIDDSVKQIKDDIKCNGCVIDAIYYENDESVTLFNHRFTKDDILGNILLRN